MSWREGEEEIEIEKTEQVRERISFKISLKPRHGFPETPHTLSHGITNIWTYTTVTEGT